MPSPSQYVVLQSWAQALTVRRLSWPSAQCLLQSAEPVVVSPWPPTCGKNDMPLAARMQAIEMCKICRFWATLGVLLIVFIVLISLQVSCLQ